MRCLCCMDTRHECFRQIKVERKWDLLYTRGYMWSAFVIQINADSGLKNIFSSGDVSVCLDTMLEQPFVYRHRRSWRIMTLLGWYWYCPRTRLLTICLYEIRSDIDWNLSSRVDRFIGGQSQRLLQLFVDNIVSQPESGIWQGVWGYVLVTAASYAAENAPKCTISRVAILLVAKLSPHWFQPQIPPWSQQSLANCLQHPRCSSPFFLNRCSQILQQFIAMHQT